MLKYLLLLVQVSGTYNFLNIIYVNKSVYYCMIMGLLTQPIDLLHGEKNILILFVICDD